MTQAGERQGNSSSVLHRLVKHSNNACAHVPATFLAPCWRLQLPYAAITATSATLHAASVAAPASAAGC
jgi:hypothetical protein